MKTIFSIVLLIGWGAGLQAQTANSAPAPTASFIVLKNGESISAHEFQRKGDQLTVAVTTSTGGKGQIAYNIADVAELKLEPPPALAEASVLVANGRADRALALIEPVVFFQQSLRDIKGNWWANSALAKSSALFALNRGSEAAPLLKDVVNSSTDPEIQVAAKLQLALISPPKDPIEALAAYDAIINQSTDAKTLSVAWIAEGDIHYSRHEFDEAVLAYLTILVFYPDHNPLVPKALWGVAQSYGKLKDTTNAEKKQQELITNYPNSPEAALAKAEHKKKEAKS